MAEAFVNIYYLERSCQAQIKAQSSAGKTIYPSKAVCERTRGQYERPTSLDYCNRVWTSALRLIEEEGLAGRCTRLLRARIGLNGLRCVEPRRLSARGAQAMPTLPLNARAVVMIKGAYCLAKFSIVQSEVSPASCMVAMGCCR